MGLCGIVAYPSFDQVSREKVRGRGLIISCSHTIAVTGKRVYVAYASLEPFKDIAFARCTWRYCIAELGV